MTDFNLFGLTGGLSPARLRLVRTEGYRYDRAGNVREVIENWAEVTLPNRKVTNTYDGVYRLIEEKDDVSGKSLRTTTYQYDKAYNRTQKTFVKGSQPAEITTYAIGTGSNGAGANQLASFTKPDATTVTFAYDLNGSRVSRTENGVTDAYSYDYHARLVSLDRQAGEPDAAGHYQYHYDHRTRRVRRTEKGAITQVVFSGGLSTYEYPVSGGSLTNPEVEYVRGPDLGGGVRGLLYSLRKDESGNPDLGTRVRRYNLMNHRGDVAGKTDESGTVTYAAHYEAFGKRSEEVGTDPDRQKANTKDEDPTGLLNEGFRYRDLETGTFLTRDPAGFVDGPNLYTYVRQNPWSKFDPKGLFSWQSFGKGLAIGAGIAALVVIAVVAAPAIVSAGLIAAGASAATAAAAAAVTSTAITVGATVAAVASAPAIAGEVASVVTGDDIGGSWKGFENKGSLSDEARSEKAGNLLGGLAGGAAGKAAGNVITSSARTNLAKMASTQEANLAKSQGAKQGAATAMVSKKWDLVTGRSTKAAEVPGYERRVSDQVRAEYGDVKGKGPGCGEAEALTKADAGRINMQGGVTASRLVGGPRHADPIKACPSCQPVVSSRRIKDAYKNLESDE